MIINRSYLNIGEIGKLSKQFHLMATDTTREVAPLNFGVIVKSFSAQTHELHAHELKYIHFLLFLSIIHGVWEVIILSLFSRLYKVVARASSTYSMSVFLSFSYRRRNRKNSLLCPLDSECCRDVFSSIHPFSRKFPEQ